MRRQNFETRAKNWGKSDEREVFDLWMCAPLRYGVYTKHGTPRAIEISGEKIFANLNANKTFINFRKETKTIFRLIETLYLSKIYVLKNIHTKTLADSNNIWRRQRGSVDNLKTITCRDCDRKLSNYLPLSAGSWVVFKFPLSLY